jgi:hypothetical protein
MPANSMIRNPANGPISMTFQKFTAQPDACLFPSARPEIQ